MAGFLAPTITEIAAAPSAPAVRQDTSIGDLLGNIGGIVSSLSRGTTTTTTQTQSDRDTATATPFVVEAQRIEALRATGKLSANQIDALIRKNKLEAVTAFSGRSENIIKSLASVHGEDIDVKEVDLVGAFDAAMVKFFAEDPRGQTLAPSIIVPDKRGGINKEATRLKGIVVYEAFLAQSGKDQQAAEELARLKTQSGIRDEELKLVVDPFIAENTAAALSIIAGLGNVLDLTPESNVIDVATLIQEAKTARNQFALQLAARAATRGLTNEPTLYNPEDILKLFDGPIALLTDLQGQPEKIALMQQSQSDVQMGATIAAAGVALTPESRAYFSSIQLDARRTELTKAAMDWILFVTPPTVEGLQSLPTEADPTSVFDPAFTSAAAKLPEFRQIEVARNGIEGFYLAEISELNGPAIRETATEQLTRGMGVMLASGRDVPVATFDQTFRPEFTHMFLAMTDTDDELSLKFTGVVKEFLATVVDQQVTQARFLVSNNFSAEYKNLKVAFNGESWTLDFGKETGQGLGIDNREVLLKNLLKKQGLPVSMEGLISLVSTPTSRLGPFTDAAQLSLLVGDARRMVRILKPSIDYLNKIFDVNKRLGTAVQDSLVGIPDFAEEEEITHVTSAEDFANVPIGGSFSYIDTDGNRQVSTFGGDR